MRRAEQHSSEIAIAAPVMNSGVEIRNSAEPFVQFNSEYLPYRETQIAATGRSARSSAIPTSVPPTVAKIEVSILGVNVGI